MSEIRRIKHLNLVIMPRMGRTFYNVFVTPKMMYACAAVATVTLCSTLFFAARYFALSRVAAEAESLRNIGIQVTQLRREADEIRDQIEHIKMANSRIQEKTGIEAEPADYSGYSAGGGDYGLTSRSLTPDIESVREQFTALRSEVALRMETTEGAEDQIDSVMARFARIPSIRPVKRGQKTSGFGYRVHPISGMWEFHTGVDLEGDYGTTPIYATADGTVTFTGWRQGYGRTVMIAHGNGFSTLYAHNFRNLVREGEKVEKGMIIAYVGASGTTTGPHVHYEVLYRDRILNPVKFLSLDIRDINRF